jgi:hypothetical protein
VEKYGRQATDGKIIQCMHFACYITEATNTHSEYMATVIMQMHFSVTLVYIGCLVQNFVLNLC